MDDPGVVRHLEPAQRLDDEIDGALNLEARVPFSRDDLGEIVPLHVLHDEVGGPVRELPDVEHVDDVVAVDLRGGDPFVQEALDRSGDGDHVRAHELQRDRRAPEEVRRLRHGAHPPFAEEVLDLVLPVDDLAGRRVER